MANAHAIANLRANEPACLGESCERGCFFLLGSVNRNEDASCLSARRENDFRYYGRKNTRIREFAFEHRANLLGKRMSDTVAVVSAGAGNRHDDVPYKQ